MKLSDIKPGMTIEYRGRVYGHRNLIGKDKTKTGIIKQVTPNLIAVQGQRYPDTILVNDLLSGQVQITNLKGEGEMARPKREAPPAMEITGEGMGTITCSMMPPPIMAVNKL